MKETIVQQPATTAAQKGFDQLPAAETERSTFDMSHGYKTTFDFGRLIPCFCMEILPGDTFSVSATAFLRLSTPLNPVMDNMQADIHYFFVPNRLVWENWQRFMGERVRRTDNPEDYTVPLATVELQTRGTLADYFGLPRKLTGHETTVNALPFRAYRMIYNEWFRDQDLSDPFEGGLEWGDATDDWRTSFPCRRAKRKDYFTSARPLPQKGDPVYLPLGTWAPVEPGESPGSTLDTPRFTAVDSLTVGELQLESGEGNTVNFAGGGTSTGPENLKWSNNVRLHTDLTTATAATINDIRTAFQIQRLLEKDARSGTRYIEMVMAHFGVQSADSRVQRPEFLGVGSGHININPVASTAAVDSFGGASVPQANLAATGTGVIKAGFNHSFTEHGYVIGLISARADLTYQNGLHRMWTRQTRYDFYFPVLAHLGEQAIKNEEIYFSSDPVQNAGTWGFQERYAEYRYHPGRITGAFHSNDSASLDAWHLAQDFDALPPLNDTFVTEDPPISRIVAVDTEPDLLCDIWFNVKATRPMPVYAVPGLVDHF